MFEVDDVVGVEGATRERRKRKVLWCGRCMIKFNTTSKSNP